MSMTACEFRRQFSRHSASARFMFERYAWPGGYPRYLVTRDDDALCHACVDAERAQIHSSALDGSNDGWAPEGVYINWEDYDLMCDHCGERIESAYGERAE